MAICKKLASFNVYILEYYEVIEDFILKNNLEFKYIKLHPNKYYFLEGFLID
jgi:hypothetical protein